MIVSQTLYRLVNSMKCVPLFFLLVLISFESIADLRLDTSQEPKKISSSLDSFFNREPVWPYENLNTSEVAKIRERWDEGVMFNYFGGSQFAWIYNGKLYYSSVVSFERKDSIKLENQDIAQIFMFNPDITLAAIGPLKINKDKKIKGRPNFLRVKAMAVAKTIPDAMLVTVDYYDSAKFLTSPSVDFPVLTSTFLVRFNDSSGKLKVEQDDSCLGNPNLLKSITAARKALTTCGAR